MATPSSVREKIRLLISRTGQTQAEFATSVNLDASKLSKSLSGVRQFSSLDLARIASHCRVTVDELLDDASVSIAARTSSPDHSEVLDLAIAQARQYAQLSNDLANLWGIEDTSSAGPPVNAKWVVQQGVDAAEWALERLADAHKVLSRDLSEIIEDAYNVDVAIITASQGFDGLALTDPHTRLILVGTSNAPGRQRFTLAHELAHLLFGDDQGLHLDLDVWSSTLKDSGEKRANSFASAFLMPESLIRERVGKSSITEAVFCDLSCWMSVSPSALSWRLFNLGLLDETRRVSFGQLSAGRAAAVAGVQEDFAEWIEQAQRTKVPRRLLYETLKCYLDGRSTLRPFANLINRPIGEVRSMIETVYTTDVLV